MVDIAWPYNIHNYKLITNSENQRQNEYNTNDSEVDLKSRKKGMYYNHDDVRYNLDLIKKLERSI